MDGFWTCKADYLCRFIAASIAHDGKVMVKGGLDSEDHLYEPTPSVLVYDPTTDVWQTAQPLPYSRSECCATTAPDGDVILIEAYRPVLHYRDSVWTEATYPGGPRYQTATGLEATYTPPNACVGVVSLG